MMDVSESGPDGFSKCSLMSQCSLHARLCFLGARERKPQSPLDPLQRQSLHGLLAFFFNKLFLQETMIVSFFI